MTEVGLWPLCPLGLSHTPRPTPLSTVTPTKVAPPCSLSTHTHTQIILETQERGEAASSRTRHRRTAFHSGKNDLRAQRPPSCAEGQRLQEKGPSGREEPRAPGWPTLQNEDWEGGSPLPPLTGHLTHSGLAEDQRTRALPSQLHHGSSAGGTNTAVPWLGALTQPLPWFHKASATP